MKVVFALFADGTAALTMNVIAIRFTDAAFWQRSLVPSVIVLNHFTADADIIVACRSKLKRNITHLTRGVVGIHRRRKIVGDVIFVIYFLLLFLGFCHTKNRIGWLFGINR